jgi:hypothetical protein
MMKGSLMGLIFRNKGPTPDIPEKGQVYATNRRPEIQKPDMTDQQIRYAERRADEEEAERIRRLKLENTHQLREAIGGLPEYSLTSSCQLCGFERATTEKTLVTLYCGVMTSVKTIWKLSESSPQPLAVLSRACPNCKNSWYEKPLNWEQWTKGFKNEQQ